MPAGSVLFTLTEDVSASSDILCAASYLHFVIAIIKLWVLCLSIKFFILMIFREISAFI
jgi:hypothetical protein